jgi:pyridoxal phosphate enzyme (YggS family)
MARERIERAARRVGRRPEEVRLLAVTKTVPVPSILEAYAAGQRLFGENRVQEALAKIPALPPDAEWHLVGPLQTNKARQAVRAFRVVQTVDRERLVAVLARLRREGEPLPALLVEVNVGREPQKAGVLPEALEGLLAAMADAGLEPQGLMAIPPANEDPRPYFRTLRALRDRFRSRVPSLQELSMGMSADFEIAVEEGATLVRLGTWIFGPREGAERGMAR